MRLTIKNTGRISLQGLIRGRYDMIDFTEDDKFYAFTFTDNKEHKSIEVKLHREGTYSNESKNWQYFFRRGNQCVTADWFRNINNVRWALTEQLKTL